LLLLQRHVVEIWKEIRQAAAWKRPRRRRLRFWLFAAAVARRLAGGGAAWRCAPRTRSSGLWTSGAHLVLDVCQSVGTTLADAVVLVCAPRLLPTSLRAAARRLAA
jgi:hypothetical protein